MDKAQAVSLGLFVAWCINDAEELVTLADSSGLVAERAPAFLPLPEAFRRGGFSKKHTYHGIATMGVLVGTASLAGYVTHGRSPLFRGALVTFGAHGCTHVASALAASAWVCLLRRTSVVTRLRAHRHLLLASEIAHISAIANIKGRCRGRWRWPQELCERVLPGLR